MKIMLMDELTIEAVQTAASALFFLIETKLNF
jgi:hypothetical protein